MTRALTVLALLLAVLRLSAASFFSDNAFFYPAGTNAASVAIADLNLDGWPDIVTASPNNPELWVLTNKTDGTFAPASRIPAAACDKIIAQDVNGDARPDLLLLRNQGAVLVYTNGGGSFTFASSNQLDFVDTEGFAMADLDGDGWIELLSVRGGPIMVFTNDHSGAFTFSTNAFAWGFYPWAIVPADFNNDGRPDLLVSHWEDRPVIMTNDGHGVLSHARFIDGFGGPVVPRAADINHDGLADCFFNGVLVINNGSNNFTSTKTTNSLLALADLDADGWIDIIGATLNVRTNDHLNSFAKTLKLSLPASPRDIAIADLDKNGRPDVVTVNGTLNSGGSVTVVLQYAQVPLAIRLYAKGGTDLVITWLATDPIMFLEKANHVGPAPVSWSPVASILNPAGTHYEVYWPAVAPMEFFRLHDN